MKLIFHHSFIEHDTGMHPESKKRLDAFGELESADIDFNESVIKLIHTEDYIEKVKLFSHTGRSLSGETHTSEGSYTAAVYAANATILASGIGT